MLLYSFEDITLELVAWRSRSWQLAPTVTVSSCKLLASANFFMPDRLAKRNSICRNLHMNVEIYSRAQQLVVYMDGPEKLEQFLNVNPGCANDIVLHETLLFTAVRVSTTKTLILLNQMSKQALEHANEINQTVLHVAARVQNGPVLAILADHMSIECVSKSDSSSCTALHLLVSNVHMNRTLRYLVDSMIRKMNCFSLSVRDFRGKTILNYLLESEQFYQSEINLLETKMSLDSSCRVYFRRKDERARHVLAEFTSDLLRKLNADVMKIVHAYIAYDTLTQKRKLASK